MGHLRRFRRLAIPCLRCYIVRQILFVNRDIIFQRILVVNRETHECLIPLYKQGQHKRSHEQQGQSTHSSSSS